MNGVVKVPANPLTEATDLPDILDVKHKAKARMVFLAQERSRHAGENDTELFPGTHPPGALFKVAESRL